LTSDERPIGLLAIEGWMDSMKEKHPDMFDVDTTDRNKYSEYYKSSLGSKDDLTK
jgi:hypothetical protein